MKECMFCKKIIINKKIPVCERCRRIAKENGIKIKNSTLKVLEIAGPILSTVVLANLKNNKKL